MSLSQAEVEHLAHLARLRLDPAELERMRAQVSAILDYVARLQEVAVEGVPPTAQVTELVSVLRADTLSASLSPEEALAAAPARRDALFRVKGVFGEGRGEA